MIEQLAFRLKEPRYRRKMPAEPIHRAAEIEGPYRWTAARAWAPGQTILWVCLNPSIADGRRDDPTMLRMMGFSFTLGLRLDDRRQRLSLHLIEAERAPGLEEDLGLEDVRG